MGFAILHFKRYENFIWLCSLFDTSPINFSSASMKFHNQYYHRALRPQFWWRIPYLKEKERKIKLLSWLQFFFQFMLVCTVYVCIIYQYLQFTICNSHVKSTLFLFLFFIRFQYLSLLSQFWILHNYFWPGFSGSFFLFLSVSGSQIKWHFFCFKMMKFSLQTLQKWIYII